jgi:tetratricopeptide (TPR) repeat protein
VVESAGGNPLFAEQFVAYAGEGGAVDVVPPSAEALIAARLDLLDPPELAVLQRAAVVGRLFSRSAVEDLSQAPDLPVGDQLLGLAGKGLVHRRRGGFRFHHVLVRDVAYASLPKAERSELHERLADWLDERGEPDELVGYHLEQAYRLRAELGRIDGRARRLAADAGWRLGAAGIDAWKRGDTPATVNLLTRATALLPEHDSNRTELCCELGLALRTAGDFPHAEETLVAAIETAAAAGDRRLGLRARLELAYVRLFSDPEGRANELLDVAAQALPVFEAVEDDRSLGRAWLTLSFVHGSMHLRFDAAYEAAERALEHHRRSGWPIAACLAFLASAAQNGPMHVSKAVSLCRRLLAQADLGGEANVLPPLAELEAMRGRFGETRRLVANARAAYDQLGQHALAETNCGAVEGRIELLAGENGAAEQSFRASCEALERIGGLAYLSTRAAELGDVLYELGRYDEAERWARRSQELGAPDDVLTQLLSQSVLARLSARKGELREADELSLEAIALSETTDALNRRGKALLDRAEVLRLADRCDEAGTTVERAIELFEQKGNAAASQRARATLAELSVA